MRRFDLVAFDVDGTLVRDAKDRTVWEVLNERFTGRPEVNKERFRRYRSGEISYAEWVAMDIGGWRDAGASRDELIQAFEPLSPVGGVDETLARLGRAGCRLVVISGTLDLMLHTLLPHAPFDEVYANHIGFDDRGRITHWRATPFDMEGKAQALRAVAMRAGIRVERCAYVGDSVNDVWIARAAGFTVAFNCKSDELELEADVSLKGDDLRAILPHLLECQASTS